MKIYHTETQEDFDALMIELDSEGITWHNGQSLTKDSTHIWNVFGNRNCIRVTESIAFRALKYFYEKKYSSIPIIKYEAKDDGSLMKPTKETSIVKEVIAYQIDTKAIRVNSVIQYREKGKDWVRGLVKFVDNYSVKVVRSYGTNQSFSSTSIGSGDIEIKVEIY